MIQFTSISPFLEQVYAELSKGRLNENVKLEIDTSKPNSLLDLFALGRLLAFIRELRLPLHRVETAFHFPSPNRSRKTRTHIENLRQLGFFEYCALNDIECRFDPKAQLPLPTMTRESDSDRRQLLEGRKYWKCLIPLKEYAFEKPLPGNERQVSRVVNDFIKGFAKTIQSTMGEMAITPAATGLEVSRILFSIVRELLSNIVTHSTRSEFLFAMTISRDTWTGYRPHRPGVTLLSGQDKYEILVVDFGQGVSPSVINILEEGKQADSENDYFSLTKWNDLHQMSRAQEESLLTNIFRGDLVIRKGRKSEGLYELGQSLSWFGGVLSLFTGRSELVISSAENEELSPELRRLKDRYLKNSYYLPGVIASPILPSHQLKTAYVQNIVNKSQESRGTLGKSSQKRPCVVRRLSQLPTGIFGGMADIKIRRRSELDAELISSAYEKARDDEHLPPAAEAANKAPSNRTSEFRPFFWDINLKMSDNIDVSFLDGLIQELCKRLDHFETPDSKNFFKLVFTNVPRNIINSLQKRNCRSFLMLKGTFCLMFDEADEPHFLGVPRVSNNIVDIEEALNFIFKIGSTTKDSLLNQEYLGISPTLVEHLANLLGTNNDSMFFTQDLDGDLMFECYDIVGALTSTRLASLDSLKDFYINEAVDGKLEAVFKLRNGTYVDAIYDFCLFWSDENKLIDCVKLLLNTSGFPLVDTIVAFMNNGDRLAAAIQRFTKAPTLVFVDPHRPASWKELEIDGEFVLVVDALYPGDDHAGYIKNFVEGLGTVDGKAHLHEIWSFFDFRDTDTDQDKDRQGRHAGSRLGSTAVVSVPIPEQLRIPRRVVPDKQDNIVQNFQTYVLSKPILKEPLGKREGEELPGRTHHYSPIELSTEFWQNISALGVIDSKRTGREDRNVLFYENNERLVQNSRLRRIMTEFVADYLKNVLNLRVDVVLHPTHPVGSFLAQLVSKQLNSNPLVLPLTQRRYGGQIELSTSDYEYFEEVIVSAKAERGRDDLNCLIVDDSVLTGNSLFTMMGVAANLGLRVNGVLVLLSRLSPEISRILSVLPGNFAYLYRLHMPILTSEESPDTKLREINEEILGSSSSYFAQLWASALKDELTDRAVEGSHFQPSNEEINQETPPQVPSSYLEDIRGEHMETYVLRQIINNLLLHPDPFVLNFYTRVAIAYNFLGQLVYETDFWELLSGLFECSDEPKAASQSTMLIRKVLYILAFSKHIFPFEAYKRFQETCSRFIQRTFEDGRWVELKDFLTDCIMWLGVIGSERLTEIGKVVLTSVLRYSLDTSSESKSLELPYLDQRKTITPESRKAAMDIIGSFAWSIRVYVSKKGVNFLENGSAQHLIESIVQQDVSMESNLVLIDIMEPLAPSHNLRRTLGIETWATEDEFLQQLATGFDGMVDYLQEAPGFTCTLKTVLRICKADTILLYAKNRSDKEFFLRVFETRHNKRADDELKSDCLKQSYLPEIIKIRMNESLFFSSNRADHAKPLDDFSVKSKHLWCMGGPVTIRNSEMIYYVILGYSQRRPKPTLQSTTYYYWLKCESLLQQVLPQIHSKYVESATAWNAHIQSIRPFHPIKADDQGRTEMVNARREIVSLAMTKIDIGDLLRRAVRMSSEPVFPLEAIRGQIVKVCKDLRIHIGSVLFENRNRDLFERSLLTTKDLPILDPSMDAITAAQKLTFCAVPIAVLEFIAYESLFNAIAYHYDEIKVGIEFKSGQDYFDIETDVQLVRIQLTVSNNIHPASVSQDRPIKPVGISACETAASAVNGNFKAGYNEDKTVWISTLNLPAFCLPETLRRQLHELLI
jgi:adenine/guanine phosphoribosyltransferase-like PRPP-binding protein